MITYLNEYNFITLQDLCSTHTKNLSLKFICLEVVGKYSPLDDINLEDNTFKNLYASLDEFIDDVSNIKKGEIQLKNITKTLVGEKDTFMLNINDTYDSDRYTWECIDSLKFIDSEKYSVLNCIFIFVENSHGEILPISIKNIDMYNKNDISMHICYSIDRKTNKDTLPFKDENIGFISLM